MNEYEQNGRQPPAPPSDPRNTNTSASDQRRKYCRDFVWGICTKGAQCKFRHELEWEFMRNTLRFCHDHQNRTGCARPDCMYLHVTKEEENLFLNSGEIPRVLADRYAAMSSMNMGLEGLPQGMYEYMAAPPPPPPPVQNVGGSVNPQPVMMTSGTGLQPLMQVQMGPMIAPVPPLLAPPPPPPPPPPTVPTTTMVNTTPIYTAPPLMNSSGVFPVSQAAQSSFPVMYDPTRPPPVPTSVTPSNGLKRSVESCEAGPSKLRKMEGYTVTESLCENCIESQFRVKMMQTEMRKLELEIEYQSYILEKKTEEYENGKLLLKTVVNSDLYRVIDDYVEGTSESAAHYNNPTPSCSSDGVTAQVPKQFLLQLMECAFNSQRNAMGAEPTPSTSRDELSLLQSTLFGARLNVIHTYPSPDLIQAAAKFIGIGATAPNQPSESRVSVPDYEMRMQMPQLPSEAVVNLPGPSGMSGSGVKDNPYLNGQKLDHLQAVHQQATVRPNVYAAPHAPDTSGQYLPPHVTHAGPVTVPVAPMAGPRAGAPPPMPRPSTSAAPPVPHHPQAYEPYGTTRYSTHYYPPFQ